MIKEGNYPVPVAEKISEVAHSDILQTIRTELSIPNYLANEIMDTVGFEWTSKQGNWPKRLVKVMKKHGHKLNNDIVSRLGKTARESCSLSSGTILRVTSSFDWSDGEYGDKGSCFWGCRSAAKYILRQLDSFALLLHGENDKPVARCWCTPLPDSNNSAWVLYNSYCHSGEPINLISFSRIVSDIFNLAYYRNVYLSCDGLIEGPLWINGGKGYIVGPPSIAEIEEVDLDFALTCDICGDRCCGSASINQEGQIECNACESDSIRCAECGMHLGEDDACYADPDSEYAYCDSCFDRLFIRCDKCDYHESRHQAVYLYSGDTVWCRKCWNSYGGTCAHCDENVEADSLVVVRGQNNTSQYLCKVCVEDDTYVCDDCGDLTLHSCATETKDNHFVCSVCLTNYYTCAECGELIHQDNSLEYDNGKENLCQNCQWRSEAACG